MWWMLVAAQLLSPVPWLICLAVIGALWRLAHPVGVVMMSTALSSVVYEGLHTGFRFAYDSEDWFLAKALANLLTFVVIASVVTTFIWAVLRERRLGGRDAVNRRAGSASKQ